MLMTSVLAVGSQLSNLDLQDVVSSPPELDTLEGCLATALNRLHDVLGRQVGHDLAADTFQSSILRTFNCINFLGLKKIKTLK